MTQPLASFATRRLPSPPTSILICFRTSAGTSLGISTITSPFGVGSDSTIATSAIIPINAATVTRTRRSRSRQTSEPGRLRSATSPSVVRTLASSATGFTSSATGFTSSATGLASTTVAMSHCSQRTSNSATSRADGIRSVGFLASSFVIKSHNQRGVPGTSSWIGCGVSSETRLSVARVLSARNGERPVVIAYSTLPKLKRSVR